MTGIERGRTDKNLERALYGLSFDYTIVFILDLDTDSYEIVFTKQTNHAQVDAHIDRFSEYVERYAKSFVVPEQRDIMRCELNRETIRTRFLTQDDYHYNFETTPNAAGLSCFQAHIVKEYSGDEHYAFLGFRSVDDVVRRQRFYQANLERVNRELECQLDLITSALPGGVKVSNDDEVYSFKYVSEQFASMLGYDTPEELIRASNGSIIGLAHPDDIETGVADALAQYAVTDHYATTYRVRCKDGSYKYVEDRGRKFKHKDGTIEHWNLFLDQNELVEQRIQLESERKANASKSEFLSRMSHDMRTPLNGIIGLIDICAKHPEDRQLVDTSREKAKVAAMHLKSLINDTLELSKLESDDAPVYEEPFNLKTVIREVKVISQMSADEAGIAFLSNGCERAVVHPYLMGNPLQVKQIALNIISNAIKYNHDGGSVTCSLSQSEIVAGKTAVELTVEDTGIGMSEEFIKNIYDPFVQADHSARSTYKGTGLGMAIVKKLIDRMGGTIDIESEPGVGTTMRVRIPFKLAAEGRQSPTYRASHFIDLTGLKVLLAEDNALNREIATFMLRDEGIEVTPACDGREAVELFYSKPSGYFDAVLMDIMMPNMDGRQAARTIRESKHDDAATIPIIAMTANAFDDDKRLSMKAGMDAHLSKPLDSAELTRTLAKLFKQQKFAKKDGSK